MCCNPGETLSLTPNSIWFNTNNLILIFSGTHLRFQHILIKERGRIDILIRSTHRMLGLRFCQWLTLALLVSVYSRCDQMLLHFLFNSILLDMCVVLLLVIICTIKSKLPKILVDFLQLGVGLLPTLYFSALPYSVYLPAYTSSDDWGQVVLPHLTYVSPVKNTQETFDRTAMDKKWSLPWTVGHLWRCMLVLHATVH